LKESDKRKISFFRGKIHLFQIKDYRVSVDLVIFLSKLRGIKSKSRVVDLGAGFGFLSIVIFKKYGCNVIAVERDSQMISLLKENLKLNRAQGKVSVIEADIRKIGEFLNRAEFDVVVMNPPFYPSCFGTDNTYRFEKDTTLKDFIASASYLLRDGGYLNLIIPSFRLYELFILLDKYNLPPRFLSLLYPTIHKPAKLAVVSAVKNVKGPLHLDRAVIVNTTDGGYTKEVADLLESLL